MRNAPGKPIEASALRLGASSSLVTALEEAISAKTPAEEAEAVIKTALSAVAVLDDVAYSLRRIATALEKNK